jgi:hypothetical protein
MVIPKLPLWFSMSEPQFKAFLAGGAWHGPFHCVRMNSAARSRVVVFFRWWVNFPHILQTVPLSEMNAVVFSEYQIELFRPAIDQRNLHAGHGTSSLSVPVSMRRPVRR